MELVKAEYIAVKKDKKTGRDIYYLLPSPPTWLTQEAVIPTYETQIFDTASESEGSQETHETFLPYIRDQDILFPPSAPSSDFPSPILPPHWILLVSSYYPEGTREEGFSSLSQTNVTIHAPCVLHRPVVSYKFEQLWRA